MPSQTMWSRRQLHDYYSEYTEQLSYLIAKDKITKAKAKYRLYKGLPHYICHLILHRMKKVTKDDPQDIPTVLELVRALVSSDSIMAKSDDKFIEEEDHRSDYKDFDFKITVTSPSGHSKK